jgi:putative ABC transport system permease protein
LGGVAGVILGILIKPYFKGDWYQHIVVPWLWMFMGMAICIVVGLLSGYYPARKLADPIESLRLSKSIQDYF